MLVIKCEIILIWLGLVVIGTGIPIFVTEILISGAD
jgi:hypothetical protein